MLIKNITKLGKGPSMSKSSSTVSGASGDINFGDNQTAFRSGSLANVDFVLNLSNFTIDFILQLLGLTLSGNN
ncbi:hypothetical protein CYY_000684 [Polysphondylium violaceum]|uniref:Uncharacterized protein n=1 Tax=Polysphondylium violaceum TaxID=133409 RepID=A0A8J4UWZ2_9MYCE|nr:hypothetical protein CYY_000684 [Polysphondylium violaceum]